MFSLSTDSLTVAAGGEAQVEVTADTRTGTVDGAYSGAIIATAGETSTRTAVATVREVESYDLTLNHTDENGAPNADYSTLVLGLDNPTFAFPYDPDGSLKVRLPKGKYLVDRLVITAQGGHNNAAPAEPGFGDFLGLPAERGDYRLTTELTRSAPFDTSTAMRRTRRPMWTARSRPRCR